MNIIDANATLLRPKEVMAMIGYKSRDSLNRLRKDDPTFPKPVPLTNSPARNASIAWALSEVQEWVERRKGLRQPDSDNGANRAA